MSPGSATTTVAQRRAGSPVIPVLVVLLAGLLFMFDVALFVFWFRAQREFAGLEHHKAELIAKQNELEDAHRQFANRKAQFCNRSNDDVTIEWLAVTYEDGGHLKLFDSQRCQDWQPIVLKSGASRMVTLSSTQSGCNWNGSVVFYATRFVRISEERSLSFKDAGVWEGFEKDCYTLQ